MLYIRGHKIIKGYVGNAPVSHVGFGKSGLIKIKSENGGSDYPNNLIAKYTTNTSGVLPTFNSGYQYTVNETELNGVYTVELFSDEDFTSCSFNGKTELLTVEYLKVTNKVTTMNSMFSNCSQLTQLDVSNFDTSNVTSMSYVFYNCPKLTQLDVSNWKTSKVINMYSMFNSCKLLAQLDVSNFDTSKVGNMQYMFYNCTNLTQLDVSNWNMNKVTTYSNMLTTTPMLAHIIMTNSDYNSVNKIIEVLPTRTSVASLLDITGVDDISLVDEETLNSKNWALSNVGH